MADGGPRARRLGGRKALAVGAGAGVLVALSIPPFGWWPLCWLGVAVLAYFLPGTDRRERLAIGAAFGLVSYLIGLMWVQEFSIFGYVGVVLVSGVYALLVVLLVPCGRRATVALGLPCLFLLGDWARDRFPLGGLPLAGLSLGQAAGPLTPVLRLGGSLALTAETVLVAVALAELARLLVPRFSRSWARRRRRGSEGGPRLGMLLVGLVVVAAALPLAGLLSPSGAGGHLAPIRVGLVQGGGPRGTRAINTDPQVVFDRHLRTSDQLSGPLDLIVWPEGVLQSRSPSTWSSDAAALADLAISHHATVIAGAEQDVGTTRYLNEVLGWGPGGQVVGRYVKNHLVPFGEYVPYRSVIDQIFNVSDVPYDAIPGRSPGFLRTPAAPVAVMISYEVFFDERARGGVRAGGQLLLVPTNTASYRSTQVPSQEVAADKLRAWETGRWLVQVTPTGYTTVVTDTGRVVRQSRLDAEQVEEAVVARRTGMTVYDHVGDATVAVLALVGWAVAAAPAVLRWRRRTGPGGGRKLQPGAH
jgi:apolipoprotein N-acyltransferase